MAKGDVLSSLADKSLVISALETELAEEKYQRNNLLALGMSIGIRRTELAKASGLRRESVYYAIGCARREKEVQA